jgi:acyl-CoA thioesterase FadM
MPSDLLSTWGVVLERPAGRAGPAGDPAAWFADGRSAYFERCPVPSDCLEREGCTLQVTVERLGPMPGGLEAAAAMIGVSVVEVRPSSFEMAVRIRALGTDDMRPVNGRCTVTIVRRRTGERIRIPSQVREEFVATQLAARDFC